MLCRSIILYEFAASRKATLGEGDCLSAVCSYQVGVLGWANRLCRWLSFGMSSDLNDTRGKELTYLRGRRAMMAQLSARRNTANKEFRKFCKKAELDSHFHFHTLKHTCASHLAMSGVSLYFIQKILGHQSIQTTTRIYAHLQPEPLLGAVKALKY